MKRYAILLIALMMMLLIGCGGEEEPAAAPTSHIDRTEVWAEEDGTVYYNVYLTEDTEWEGFDSLDIAKEALAEVFTSDADHDYAHIAITGFEADGDQAFTFSDHTITFFKDGESDYSWELTSDELTKLSE